MHNIKLIDMAICARFTKIGKLGAFQNLATIQSVTARKAVIETDGIEELTNGIICGQACYVDLIDGEVIASGYLADTIAEAMNSGEPEAFNVGFIIGLVDALLCARKTYPCGW